MGGRAVPGRLCEVLLGYTVSPSSEYPYMWWS